MEQDAQNDDNIQGYTEPPLHASIFAEPFEPHAHPVLLTKRQDCYLYFTDEGPGSRRG